MKRWLRPLAITGVLAVAALSLYVGLQAKAEEPPPVRVAGLIRIFPQPGTVALRQDAFGAELEFGYEGRLEINGHAIPDDQLDRIAGINRLSYSPGEGKEITALPEGRNCVDVYFWRASTGEASAGPPRSWCFTAS